MANDENNSDRAMMRPPDTAVRRVLLCRHRDTEMGDNNIETQVHSGDSQSERVRSIVLLLRQIWFVFVFVQSIVISEKQQLSSAGVS